MASQPEVVNYDAGVYQVETTDPVQGGVGGKTNAPLLNLANRTAYLKQHVDALETSLAGLAPLASPVFTGDPRGPTPAAGDDDTSFATTAFVHAAIAGLATVNVAGNSNITLTAAQWGVGIIVFSGLLTGNINVIFPARTDRWIIVNNSTGAFAITCKTPAGTGVIVTQGKAREIMGDATNITFVHTDYESVAMTGAPTAPTPAAGDNSTKIATTAFVNTAVDDAAIINAIIFG